MSHDQSLAVPAGAMLSLEMSLSTSMRQDTTAMPAPARQTPIPAACSQLHNQRKQQELAPVVIRTNIQAGRFSTTLYWQIILSYYSKLRLRSKSWTYTLGLYSNTIFYTRYCQPIIHIFVILSVTVEHCDRCNEKPYMRPYKVMTGIQEHNVCARVQPEPLLLLSVFIN